MAHKNATVLIFLAIVLGLFAILYFTVPSRSFEVSPVTSSAPLELSVNSIPVRKQVIGFLPSWSIAQKAKVYPEYLDQIIYFGIGINEQGELMKYNDTNNETLEWHYFQDNYFQDIMQKAHATDTDILVALKNFDNASIDNLISSQRATNKAINEVNTLITTYDLDGVNIDFEYFTDSDFPTAQHMNTFLHRFVSGVKKDHPHAIISFDVNATALYIDRAYDMVRIGELVDQVIVMGYDYYRQDANKAGPVAPLSSQGDTPSVTKSLTALKGRVPDEKIILALPLYGYEWQTYTKEYGSYTIPGSGALASYKRVRDLISHRDDISISYDEFSQSPRLIYTQNGAIKQIYYEDEKSIKNKIELIHQTNSAGIALWALGYEGDYIEPWLLIKDAMWGP